MIFQASSEMERLFLSQIVYTLFFFSHEDRRGLDGFSLRYDYSSCLPPEIIPPFY